MRNADLPCRIVSINQDGDSLGEDDHDLYEVLKEVEALFKHAGVRPDSNEEFFEACLAPDGRVLGASAVGLYDSTPDDADPLQRPRYSFSVAVDEAHRRKGIARALIESVLGSFQKDEVLLEGKVVNPHIVALLRELGFEYTYEDRDGEEFSDFDRRVGRRMYRPNPEPPMGSARRNSDADLRALERRARESQAPSDMATLISARVRAGMTDPWLVRAAATIGLGSSRGHEAARLVAESLSSAETRLSERAGGPGWRIEGVGYSQWISGLPRGDSGRPCAICGNAYGAHSADDASCPGGEGDGPFWVPASDERLDAMARAEVLRGAMAGDTGPILTLINMLRTGTPDLTLILLGGDLDDTDDEGLVGGDLADLFGLALTIEDYRDEGIPPSLSWFWRHARPILREITVQAMLDLADEFLGLPATRRVVPGSPEWNAIRAKLELMRRRPRVAWFLGLRKKLRAFAGLGEVDPWTAADAELELPSYGHGGYPIIYSVDDDEMCGRCANQMDEPWTLSGANTFMEGPPIFCSGCAEMIESAYGDPNAEDA